jgi:hypothetical protein
VVFLAKATHGEIPQLAKPGFGLTNDVNFCNDPKENDVPTRPGRRHLLLIQVRIQIERRTAVDARRTVNQRLRSGFRRRKRGPSSHSYGRRRHLHPPSKS